MKEKFWILITNKQIEYVYIYICQLTKIIKEPSFSRDFIHFDIRFTTNGSELP